MKRILFTLLLILFTATAPAEIIELKSYKDLNLKDISPETLVVFDIDNTLLRQNSMIGTHQWGDFLAERAVRAGIDSKIAKESQYKAFAELQPAVTVVPVESEILEILATLSKNKISHFALTARNSKLQDITIKQLQILGHDFAASFPKLRKADLMKNHLKGGVIFSGSTPKGELLKKIIDNGQKKFTRVIFIDDKAYNLESVEKSFTGSSIELKSYRYAAADPFLKNFDPAVADVVYSIFKINGVLVTDEAARATLVQMETKAPPKN